MRLPDDDLKSVLDRTGLLWEGLRNRRLFITGGTGFFGCWLLETFAAANAAFELQAEAVVLTRNPEKFAKKAPHLVADSGIRLFPGDVSDFPFPAGKFSHIIHAATTSSAPVSNSEMASTILDGTRRVLAFAATSGAEQLLFTSSGAVYGPQSPDLSNVPETFQGAPTLAPNPLAVYGEGKRMAELLCSIAHQETGLNTKIARCFAFVGPHLPLEAHFAIGNFIRDAMAGRPIQVQGDGSPFRSYLYAADLAVWLWTILFKGEPGRPYNVGSSQAISIRDLAATIGSLFNVPVQIAKPANPGTPAARYVPDTCRAETELGLKTWTSLEEAIRKTAEWHQSGTPTALRAQRASGN
jgi:dTDP-glucose 4,6-dehydratase